MTKHACRKYIIGLAPILSSFLVAFSILPVSQLVVFAQPEVKISPACGPKSGFNFDIMGDGFTPNTNINWKLVGSDGQIPLSGYFQTDSTGYISDTTFADDLKKGHYKMYFGEDANNDGNFDLSANPIFVELDIPCKG
jgi:hypothetical protein